MQRDVEREMAEEKGMAEKMAASEREHTERGLVSGEAAKVEVGHMPAMAAREVEARGHQEGLLPDQADQGQVRAE